ncbi:MAG: thioesterase family protein [Chitinophagales bacterium]
MVQNKLTATTSIRIRFSETDALGIAWHGNFLTYFEDGRDAFGDKFGMHYMDIFNNGFIAPIVKVSCDYKKMVNYGDTVLIDTTYENCASSKLILHYKLYTPESNETIATGSTTQVFLDAATKKLQLRPPAFLLEWKQKHHLI